MRGRMRGACGFDIRFRGIGLWGRGDGEEVGGVG
jgi:hypothetical protein